MQLYNKIMLYFWLFVAVLTFLVITYKGFQDDFKIWGYYYVIPAIAIFMFFARRFMMRRMEKHIQWMEEQKAKEE